MEKQIVACIDDSVSSAFVCDWAAWVSLKIMAPLKILHVLDRTSHPLNMDLSGSIGLGTREYLLEELTKLDEQRNKIALKQGQQMLETAKDRVENLGVKDVQILQRHANLVETLAEIENEIRVVIVGRKGKTSEDSLEQIGSQLESIIRTLQAPILVSLSNFQEPKRILIAFDGSPTAFKMLGLLAKFPQLFSGIECHVVMIGGESATPLKEAKEFLLKEGYACITAQPIGDALVATLQAYVRDKNIDMIVMGAYGHSPIRRFILGSNTTKMLHQTRVPLLLLR